MAAVEHSTALRAPEPQLDFRAAMPSAQSGAPKTSDRCPFRLSCGQGSVGLGRLGGRVFYDVTDQAVEVLAIVTKAQAARWLAEHGE
jgi:hypothetical protein